MYKTQESKLKMFTFIIRPNNIQIANEGVGVVFGYDLESALAKVKSSVSEFIKDKPEMNIIIQHKGTFEMDKLGLEALISSSVPLEKDISLFPSGSPLQLKVEGIGEKLAGLLLYLLQDENAEVDRKKLSIKDINDLRRIIKKL